MLLAQPPGHATPDILVLHSYHPSLSWNQEINRGIKELLSSELDAFILEMEYIDSKRLFDSIHQHNLIQLYAHKFRGRKFDVIIATDDDALRFLQAHGNQIFPGTPVVFCGVNIFDPDLQTKHPHITGVIEEIDIKKTLDVALELFPATQHIYFFGDRSTTAFDLTQVFQTEYAGDFSEYSISYHHHNSLSEIIKTAQAAPNHSIALLWPFVGHHGGLNIEMKVLPQALSAATDLPLFGFWHFNLGHGIIGGKLVSGYQQGKYAARMAVQILNGENPANIPVITQSPNEYFFDYKLLVRHGLAIDQLPKGSSIINKPLSFKEKYISEIRGVLAGLSVFFLFFMAFLYADRRIRQVMKTEIRFQQALMDALPNPVFYSFDSQSIDGCNTAFEKLTGSTKDQVLGKSLHSIYLPTQIQEQLALNQELMITHKPVVFEGNVLAFGGKIRDALFYKSAIYSRKTKKFGVIETIIDITEKKLASEKIRLSEERYALATRATMDGIWDWNLQDNLLFTSDRVNEILGYFPSNQTNASIEEFEKYVHPEDLGVFKHQFNMLTSGEKSSCTLELRVLTKEEKYMWMELKAFAVSNSKGSVYRLVGSISDIQERKEAETALRKWEDIFRNTLMGIIISYPESMRMDLINPVFAHMHGFKLEELQGRPIESITSSGEEEKIKAALERAARENHYVFESTHQRSDKTCFPVMVDITAVKNNSGKIIYYIINVQDISIRKRQERKITQMLQREQSLNEELRSNEEELKQMLDQTIRYKERLEENQNQLLSFINGTSDFTLLKDRNLKYLLVNESFADFYNKNPNEFIGKSDLDILPPAAAEKYSKADLEILETGKPIAFEESFLGQYYETRKFPVFHGNQVIAIGAFIRNITQQKLAEKQVQANELRLKALLENSVDLITLTNQQGFITWCTNTSSLLTGQDPVSLTGKLFSELIHESDRPLWQQQFNQVIKQPGKPLIINHRIKKQGKDVLHFKTVLVNHLNNPAIESIVITSHDISLEVQSQELQKNIIVAQKSAEIKQQFLANMSHEIRTPMNGIIGMIDLLQNTPLNDLQKDFVETIRISSDSLLKIINDILDFSKIEAGKMTITHTSVDIRKFMQEAYRLFTALTRQKNLEFSLIIDPQLPQFILTDPIRLNQVLSNLLSNAIKFTPSGKISLTVSVEEVNGNIYSVLFEVEDTGIGISRDDQEKLFQAFSQIDSSLTRSQEGTGLGLAISQKIIEQMDGQLGVRSQLEKGSVFWFRIFTTEVHKKEKAPDPVYTRENTPPLNMNILLVEDKEVNQKVIRLMLEEMGCTVQVAANGQLALNILAEVCSEPGKPLFDAILMDIQMPVMDGITATRIIRERFPQAKTIIGLSANVLAGDIEKYMQSGLSDYIVKPAKSAEIRQKLAFWKENNRD